MQGITASGAHKFQYYYLQYGQKPVAKLSWEPHKLTRSHTSYGWQKPRNKGNDKIVSYYRFSWNNREDWEAIGCTYGKVLEG